MLPGVADSGGDDGDRAWRAGLEAGDAGAEGGTGGEHIIDKPDGAAGEIERPGWGERAADV